jgi:hypothetical protein
VHDAYNVMIDAASQQRARGASSVNAAPDLHDYQLL